MNALALPRVDQEVLSDLHAHFVRGDLEYVVGAGPSIAARLPSWTELNARIVRAHFSKRADSAEAEMRADDSEVLSALSEVFGRWFGDSAALDVVRMLGKTGVRGRFEELLRDALYAGMQPGPAPIHCEIAAAIADRSKLRRLFTFNYDDLLEQALKQLCVPATPVFSPTEVSRKLARGSVVHLHGLLRPRGRALGRLVLTERDYLATGDRDNWIERTLEELMGGTRHVLLIGMSLTDTRLRRLLFRHGKKSKRSITAVVTRTSSAPREDIARRVAEATARMHEENYWKAWGVRFVELETHEQLPYLLRRIRLGSDCEVARHALRAFSLDWAQADEKRPQIGDYLTERVEFLRARFCVRVEERLGLSLFAITAGRGDQPCLQRVAYGESIGDSRVPVRQERHQPTRLKLFHRAAPRPQGAAGHAYLLGSEVQAERGGVGFDNHFDAGGLDRSSRHWLNSLLCWPLQEPPRWGLQGVLCLYSNARHGFWKELQGVAARELRQELQDSAQAPLRYLRLRATPED